VRLQTLAELGWRSWLALSYQALFTYGLAMLLFFTALKHLDVAVASLSLYLLPVFGVVLAAILLGERLGAAAICGTAVVLTATLLIVRYEQIGPRPEPLTEVK
jgi:drug/metabolite transporter (DMT)-like permease